LLVLGTAVVGLAFPAGAMAATEQITTKAVTKTDGFRLQVKVVQGAPTGYGGRYPNSVAGILNRTNGHATQANNYAFSSFGVHTLTFKGSRDLSSAKISGTFVNGRGSINMTFHATGTKYHVSVPKGCTGHGGYRRLGTLTGSYTLHADKLGTITQKSFQATLSTASFQCSKPSHGYDLQTIGGNPYVDIFKSKTGSVSELIEKSGSGNGWAITHTYSVKGEPSTDYKVGKNLKTATVTGAGGISGKASYTATHTISSNQTTGTMSGSLAVTMATIGKVPAFPSKRSAKQSHT
jgi:hypothetical protein